MKTSTKIMLPLTAAALFTEEMYRYIFCTPASKLFTFIFDKQGHESGYYEYKHEKKEYLQSQECEQMYIRSKRGEKLKGFYYPTGAGGKKIAFIVHGYRSEHADTAGPFYDYYKSRGFDLFCPDNVAHGESDGHFVGYDLLDSENCIKWISYLKYRFGSDIEIILHGFSMGGATVLQMSSMCPDNVKFIIDDSGYRDGFESLKANIGPLAQPMRYINKAVAGFDMKDTNVVPSMKKSSLPILFVHGYDDKLVPFETGKALFELYEGPKDSLFLPETRHIEAIFTSPELYAEKIDSFIEKYL